MVYSNREWKRVLDKRKVMLSALLSTILLFQTGLPRTAYADEPTDTVRMLLEDNSVGGTAGLYLKEVNGPVLAAHNETFVFEPASAIKALIHFHAMKQVEDGAIINGDIVTLSTQVPWFTDQTGSCPDLTGPASDTLQNGLIAMMNPSDNRWTQAMRDFFGDANITATRQSLGMSDTKIQHLIGCGGDAVANPNQLTLVDAGKLYEAVATGYLNATTKSTAYTLMVNPTGRLDSIIDAEVAGLGLSPGGLVDFKNIRNAAEKAGSYTLNGLEYRTVGGWALLPFKDDTCDVISREYVYGTFIHGADSVTDAPAAWTISGELFRQEILSALETWAECEADLEIVSFDSTAPPAELLIGQGFQVNLTKIITNNGPASTTDVDISVSSSGAGLIVDPINAGGVLSDLESGEFAEIIESFDVTCDDIGSQEVTFSNNIAPISKEDPNLFNNDAEVAVNVECVIPVQINIRPGSLSNPVNLKSQGAIPVAILTTDEGEYGLPVAIDATMIDPLSVQFGPMDALFNVNLPAGATETHGTGHLEDSLELDEETSDGDLDMILHFKGAESGLDSADTESCVKGEIDIGGSLFTFFGCDSVGIVP